MKTKTQGALAWIFMLILLGGMTLTLYADYQKEVRNSPTMRVMYP
jgi:hypothetical protein